MASSFSWKESDVRMLIEKRIEYHNMYTGKRGSALAGWRHIAEVLNNGATYQQCKKKWENLLQKYRDIVAPLGKDEPVTVKWQYFEDLHPFVSAHQYVNAPLICKSEHEVVTVQVPRTLLKCTPSSPDASTQADAQPVSVPSATKKLKVESRSVSVLEDGQLDYDSDVYDSSSVHSVPEAEQVPVIVEITDPDCAATSRRVSQASECKCPSCPLGALKGARLSDVRENLDTFSRGGPHHTPGRTTFNAEQHKQAMETLQMEYRMRKHLLQTELEMTKRILQVELEIRQEELDFKRSFHRLQLKKITQNLMHNS